MDQESFRMLLTQLFDDWKKADQKNSLRGFSEKLGVSSASLSEILRGKRNVSVKKAQSMLERLSLTDEEQRRAHLALNPDVKSEAAEEFQRIGEEDLEIIIDPLYFTILSLLRTKDFVSDVDLIAEKVGRSPSDVQRALLKLQQFGIIKFNTDRSFKRTPGPLCTSDDVTSAMIQRAHRNDIDKIRALVLEKSERLQYAKNLMIPTNPALLPRAKELIRMAQDELDSLLKEDATEVYRLCTYFFPVSKVH